MGKENEFAEFKYQLFKNGAPDPKVLATKYREFRDNNAISDSAVVSKINTEIYNLMKKNPSDAVFYFEMLPFDMQESITMSDECTEELKNLIKAQQMQNQEISRILITSGYSFEGYRIVKYSGYISGDDATLVKKHVGLVNYGSGVVSGLVTAVENSGRAQDDADSFANFAQNTTDAFAKIRKQAIKELKEAAYDLDCNAVIGVDFDYVTVDTEYDKTSYSLVCVTANGNACVIEPVNDGFDNFNDVFGVKDGKVVKG